MRWLLLWLTGCASITTLDGGQTLAPATSQTQVAATAVVVDGELQAGVSAVWRRSVAADVDVGLYLRNFVPGAGVRVRTFRTPDFSLAVAPQLSGYVLPVGLLGGDTGLVATGFLQFGAPVVAEYHPNRRFSVAGALNPGVRLNAIAADPDGTVLGESATEALLTMGMGSRVTYSGRRVATTLVLDVLFHPAKPQPTELAAALEVSVLGARWRAKARRATREAR